MNKEKIELNAVSKLKELFSRFDYTIPEIPDNDKSPSWDGFIRLYNVKDSQKKEDLVNRIPVQVKGHYANPPYNNSISFSSETADLQNYLNENGVIFFVVYLNEKGDYQIYYSKLTRFILKRLLKNKTEQNNISIHLEKLPDEENDVADILFNFTLDMKMPLPEVDITINDVFEGKMKETGFDSFMLSYKGIKYKNDPWNAFLETKPTLYLKNSKVGIAIPIETDYELLIKTQEKTPVFVNGVQYYDGFERIKTSSNNVQINIGKSFTFFLVAENKNSITGKFNFKIKGNLDERINDTKFIIDFLLSKTLTIGKDSVRFPLKNEDIKQEDIEYFKHNLTLLEHVKKLLEKLNIFESLDYDSVTPENEKVLIHLINTVLLGGKYIWKNTQKTYLYEITIANISFLLSAINISDDSCNLCDFFDSQNNIPIAFSFKQSDEKFPIPKTFILREKDFIKIDNIDYNQIYNDIINNQTSDNLKFYTYSFIKEMINGYNKRTKEKNDLGECLYKCLKYLEKYVTEYNYYELLQQIQK